MESLAARDFLVFFGSFPIKSKGSYAEDLTTSVLIFPLLSQIGGGGTYHTLIGKSQNFAI